MASSSSIGPHIPAQLSARKEAERQGPPPEAGPSIGSVVPPAQARPAAAAAAGGPVPRYEEEEEDEDEDDYVPELPPDLAAARANPTSSSSSSSAPHARRPIGPARGPLRREEEEEESEDEIGPAPLPPAGTGSSHAHEDAVIEFMQKEAQRRQAIEEAARPKTLKRDEWMLVPPTSSDLLSTLDPTKLNKPRQFSRSAATPKVVDNTLWTETPAERQQRLADEVMGKKRRVENADPDLEGDDDDAQPEDAHKRRKREAELQRQVEEYTRSRRGSSLLDARAQEEAKRKKSTSEEPAAIWDHARDMGMGGRLMEEKDRRKAIQDAKGLSDRFGAGKGGSFL